ncbi:choice-of-anchor J domain-containing protein [uncultured Muribaculum sp.]|uniref:choice-of-anchor J domain-containing protein n=1 Tax=uncultured Muribaculum sp. TaxID=1918613 RepID=UPI0025F17A2E|nr:choice-of-anchor J domain-containing protein [uncultured Muribaculum sp.]
MAVLLGGSTLLADGDVKFRAAVSYPAQSVGIYEFTTDGYNPTQIARNVYASGGGIAYGDYYYGVRFEVIAGIAGVSQQSYNLKTWEPEDAYSGSIQDVATAIAYNADRDEAIGCYYNEDGATFRMCSVNIPYWGKTKIADLPKGWGACDFDKNGTLYAIDEDGMLFTVNTRTGALTEVGSTGVATEWITGGFIDKESGKMIYSVKNSTEAALYSVDLATAKATKLYDLENEEQLGGFYIPEADYAAGVPAALPYTPSLSFSGTSLSGTVRFQMPRTTYDGTAASGPLTYHVYANGKEVATGESTFGASGYVTVNVTLPESDTYSIAVSTSNEAGESPRKRASKKFIGLDTPKAPGSVNVTYADGVATVKWGSVSSGMNGGQIDRTNLVYRVTRYPDEKVVSPADQKTVSLTDAIEMPQTRTDYYYTVEAVTGELSSAPAKSATFSLGPIDPPFEGKFASASDFIGYTVLNPGADTNKWQFSSGTIYVRTSGKPADAWVLLPPVNVKAGNSYEVGVSIRGYSGSYMETFEVMVGNSPEAAALTSTVIPSTDVKSGTFKTFTGSLTAEADGIYYIGIHAKSASGGYLYVESVSIKEGVSMHAPAAVTDLKVESDASGAHKATATFTLPTLDLSGVALEAITKVSLLRDGVEVNSAVEGLTPGAEFTIVDNSAPSAGNHVYSVVCHNAHGAGASAEAEAYVGFGAPLRPDEVKMKETTPGHIVATWTPVVKDVDGRTLGADDVLYRISRYMDGEQVLVEDSVAGTTYEYDIELPAGTQKFMQTLVEAMTEGGMSKPKPTLRVAVGEAYKAPYAESFSNSSVSSLIGYEIIEGSDPWTVVASHSDYGVYPADDDGGMMFLEGYNPSKCAIVMGKIDLGTLPSPAFIFYTYNFKTSSPNTNLIEVEVNAGDGYEKLYGSEVQATGDENKWNKVVVPLDDYAGQTVQIRVISTTKQYAFHYVDAFKVTSCADHNLSLRDISAPSSVERNVDFDVAVTVDNLGQNRALGYKVHLFCNDELVDTKSGDALEPEASTEIKFTCNLGVAYSGKVAFRAEIEYGPDMVEGDNMAEVQVEVRENALPHVTDLAASATEGKVALQWSEPAGLDKVVEATTENFDDPASAWTSVVDGWTFYDEDKATIGGIGSKKIPVSGRQSFFVMNNTYEAINSSQFAAKSGTQYLCSMYVMTGNTMVQSDDWAVSPELTGKPQMISLYASSFKADSDQTQYYESFEILYSTTGNAVEDFIPVETFKSIPAAWTKYTAYLPEGAKYFAIHAISYDKYMLFVDDVTFCAKNGPVKTLAVDGYNIYRDNVKINEAPVAATSYTDETVNGTSTYSYAVTAVYAEGESRKSNDAVVDMTQSGIDGIGVNGATTVKVVAGSIIVSGAEGLDMSVFTVDGKTVYSAVATDRVAVDVVPGIYIVKAGRTAVKVVVR